MTNLDRIRTGKRHLYRVLRYLMALTKQLAARHSCSDTRLTRQRVVPFVLSEVARAFEGGLASRFVHLRTASQKDEASHTHI
jgi:hypothetical protein